MGRWKYDSLNVSDVINLYVDEKLPLRAVAERLNTTIDRVLTVLNKNNINRRNMSECHKIYKINSSYFSKIDTEQKAYILGLLYSDGNNMPERNCVRLMLHKDDIEILNKIKILLEYDNSIKVNDDENSASLEIYDKQISQDLNRYGLIKNKTFKLEFPKFLKPNLYSHFIRGYFDGDGSIGIYKNSYLFRICGKLDFMESIQHILVKECNLNFTKIYKNSVSDIYNLAYGGNIQTKRIKEYIYKDATIYINRKYKVFHAKDHSEEVIDGMFNFNSNMSEDEKKDIKAAQALLGHKQSSTTEIYVIRDGSEDMEDAFI